MTKKTDKTKERKRRITQTEAFANRIINEQVEQIDEALEKIEKRLKPYENLIEKRNQLQAARRALLGGSRLTGSGGNRLRQEDVVDYLKSNPGSTVSEMAEGMSVPYANVAGHLYRGRDERFIQKDNKWYVRDPEEGVNSADDIEEDDE